MGLCHEFGSQIRAGCDHPMRAGASACSCAECGVVCRGLFDGCPDVWARGPRPVAISATRAGTSNGAPAALAPVARLRPENPPAVRPVAAAIIGPAVDDRSMPKREKAGAAGEHHDDHRADHLRDHGAEPPGRESVGDPRREVFRWFEEAFEGVRGELQALIGSMTHQQAMLAELLDSRQAELRLALVAESLPDVVGDAVKAAMDEHTRAMADVVDRSHQRLLEEAAQIRADGDTTVDSLAEALEKLADTILVHDEEAEQRETVRLGTLKGSVTRQFGPLAEALAALGDKVDALAERLEAVASSDPPAGATTAAAAPAPWASPPANRPERTPAAAPKPPAPAARRRGVPAAAVVEAPPAPVSPIETPRAPSRPAAVRRGAAPARASEIEPPARRVAAGHIHRTDPAADDSPVVVAGSTGGNGRRSGPVRRGTGARVAASRAVDVDPVPEEPVVTYELETDDGGDDGWAAPDWVSSAEAEPEPEPEPPARTGPPRATLTKSGAAKLAAKARAARPTRSSG